MLNLTEIRQHYPTPSRLRDWDETDTAVYCVGGAICQAARTVLGFIDVDNRQFPRECDLAHVLADLNPALDDDDAEDIEDTKAWEFADAIVQSNEERDFDAAWRYAAEALAYRQP